MKRIGLILLVLFGIVASSTAAAMVIVKLAPDAEGITRDLLAAWFVTLFIAVLAMTGWTFFNSARRGRPQRGKGARTKEHLAGKRPS